MLWLLVIELANDTTWLKGAWVDRYKIRESEVSQRGDSNDEKILYDRLTYELIETGCCL